jgi:hypothetical protein
MEQSYGIRSSGHGREDGLARYNKLPASNEIEHMLLKGVEVFHGQRQ